VAADTISYAFKTNLQVLQEMTPQGLPGEGGFQSASMKVDFYGDKAAFLALFPDGGSSTTYGGSKMYFSGTLIESQGNGWIRATVYSEGFWGDEPPAVLDYHEEVEEIVFPFTNAGNVTVYYTPPSPKTKINPATGKFWNVKILQSKASGTKKGVVIGVAGTPLSPVSTASPFTTAFARGVAVTEGLPDPMLNYPFGWVRTAFDSSDIKTLGTVVFRSYTEKWSYIDAETIG